MKIIFHEVHTSKEKLKILEKICQDHIEKKMPLYFIIDDPKVTTYVDELLWNISQESFIPHKIHNEPGKALISIGNTNHAPLSCNHFFNLSANAFITSSTDASVYEFDDQTIPAKKQSTQKKYHLYKGSQAHIEVH